MSSFNLGRRRAIGVSLEDMFDLQDKDKFKFGSILQLAIFLPYFVLYLFLSTILSAFFRGGRSIWWSLLASYTLIRLWIGFALVVFFRFLQAIIERFLSFFDRYVLFRSKKETALLKKLNQIKSYHEYEQIGRNLDEILSSIQKWKKSSQCDDFDYELLELQLKTMKEKKNAKNINNLMQTISHVFRRTFCSLHNGNLYNTYCYIGTKQVIEEYYDCLTECVDLIRDQNNHSNDNVSITDKIEYFYRCKRSLGRTALCLSGGGSLSMAHCGVIRVLAQNDCLPKVISGTSGGAIIAGYLAVITDNQIKNNIDSCFGYRLANQFGARFLPTFAEQLFGAYRDRVMMDSEYFISSIKKYVGNYTFQEAYNHTGRHVNISVSYSTKNKGNKSHAHHILLNHITSPNVYIWSAITASCALPGLMKPQQLWAKPSSGNGDGKKKEEEALDMVPYYPDGIQWVDGSLQADIPTKLLQELFRVNYTIVSQVNPHVTPFLMSHESKANSFGLKVLEMLDDMASRTVNHQLDRLVNLKAIPAVYGHNFDKFAFQNFTGDITIIPQIPLNLRFKILSHPTDEDMVQYIDIGEKATWTHLQHIQHVLKIEKLIDSTIYSLRMQMKKEKNGLSVIEEAENESPPLPLMSNTPFSNSSYYLK